jgi:hypothetical protein
MIYLFINSISLKTNASSGEKHLELQDKDRHKNTRPTSFYRHIMHQLQLILVGLVFLFYGNAVLSSTTTYYAVKPFQSSK